MGTSDEKRKRTSKRRSSATKSKSRKSSAVKANAKEPAKNKSKAEEKAPEVIWAPNSKPQALFLACPYPELLFGGARGPGKTDSLVMAFMQFVGKGYGPDWKGIIFRQTYKQLEEIIAKTRRFFPAICPQAIFRSGAMEWVFPGGETLKLRHARRPADMENYQGHEYPFVGFDELCNLSNQECYEKAKAFCRSSNPNVPKMIRCTANPLGPGHLWVKHYFIDPAPPLTPIVSEHGGKRVFIPATIYDNKHLREADPDYVRRLESIQDENLRRAWLEGDWNVVAGSFFGDVWTARNIVKPFPIPKTWHCFRSFDWGSTHPFSVGWWAVSDGNPLPDNQVFPRGALIRFAEWYGAKKDRNGKTVPNEGLRISSKEVARGIVSRERSMQALYGIKVVPGPADPAIFASVDGPSIADNMACEGVAWLRADNARITGWQQMRERIWGDDGSNQLLYVFNTCTEIIRTLPSAPRDERIVDDIDTEYEDHCLTGDTLVWTATGQVPIRNLVGRSGLVFGSDGNLHRFHNARMTRRNAELVKVIFDDGTSVTCTNDHKILTNKGFVEASLLNRETIQAVFLNDTKQQKFCKVASVESAGFADVYCLDVEDVHCFAVNGGVIVHNCLDEARYACMYKRRTVSSIRYQTL